MKLQYDEDLRLRGLNEIENQAPIIDNALSYVALLIVGVDLRALCRYACALIFPHLAAPI